MTLEMGLPLMIAILQQKQELVPRPENLKGVLTTNNHIMRSLIVLLQCVMKDLVMLKAFHFWI